MQSSEILKFAAGVRPASPVVATIQRVVPPVLVSEGCLVPLDRFFAATDLYALPVVDAAGIPIALLDRRQYVEYFGKAFTRELHSRQSLADLIDDVPEQINTEPIVVDASLGIDDVAELIIARGMQHMVSGVIITAARRYAGIANGHDLLNEITRRKQAELYYLAHYDQLTGIPNRMLLADRLTQACRDARRYGHMLALLYVDLDRFKQINDSMGHGAGDELLRGVAERLRACMRDCDMVARLGGDEFVVLGDHLAGSEDANLIATRVVGAIQEPFLIGDQAVYVTASVGIVLFPRDDTEAGALLAKADAAMLERKRNGRNGFAHYSAGMQLYSLQHLELEGDIRRALQHDEFELFYQPQVHLDGGLPIGAEALLRWRHPRLGLLGPGQFIGIAEESGLITSLGAWVLAQACRDLRSWLDAGVPPKHLSVNVSALQFRDEGFCAFVAATLRRHDIPPEMIELEVTESVVMHRAESVLQTLQQLKEIGVRLAIDDFGTGFSSLSYLRRYPIDRLKIDRSFVHEIATTAVNESIVRAIVALAESLSLDLVAEGVESAADAAVLLGIGCELAQGYHFLRPAPAAEYQQWLRDRLAPTRHPAFHLPDHDRAWLAGATYSSSVQ